jgi:hypothetical protein
VRVRRTRRFKKDDQNLPPDAQQRVEEKLRFLLHDTRCTSPHVHKLRGVEGLREFSVTMNRRATFQTEGEYYVLLAVGPHRIVDRS